MNKKIIKLTDSNIKKELHNSHNEKDMLLLIDFWAEWCNPCKIISNILEDIVIEFTEKVKIAKLNIDENPITTKNYNIRSIPTLLLIKNGKIISTKIGLLSKQQLQELLNAYI